MKLHYVLGLVILGVTPISCGAKVQDTSLEMIPGSSGRHLGQCSSTLTDQGEYTIMHCLTDVFPDDPLKIGPATPEAPPVCTKLPVKGEIVWMSGYPGIFSESHPNQQAMNKSEILFAEGTAVYTSGAVHLGQSGGAVLSYNKACVYGVIMSTAMFIRDDPSAGAFVSGFKLIKPEPKSLPQQGQTNGGNTYARTGPDTSFNVGLGYWRKSQNDLPILQSGARTIPYSYKEGNRSDLHMLSRKVF